MIKKTFMKTTNFNDWTHGQYTLARLATGDGTHILNHCGSSSLYASNNMISKIHEHVYL